MSAPEWFSAIGSWLADKVLGQVIVMFAGAVIVQSYFVRRANQAAMVDYLVGRLNAINEEVLEYWANPIGEPALKQAQKVKGSLKSISEEIRMFLHRYNSKFGRLARLGLVGSRRDAGGTEALSMSMVLDLLDACTGGKFECKDAEPEPGRYLRIVNETNRIKRSLIAYQGLFL